MEMGYSSAGYRCLRVVGGKWSDRATGENRFQTLRDLTPSLLNTTRSGFEIQMTLTVRGVTKKGSNLGKIRSLLPVRSS